MKKQIILLLAMWLGASTVWASDVVSVVFYQKDGTKVAYALADRPSFRFTGKSRFVSLRSKSERLTISVSRLNKFVFSETPTAILPVSLKQGNIKNEAGVLTLAGFKSGTQVRVCDTSGAVVISSTINSDGATVLSLSALPKGVYIVSAGNTTLKVCK